MKAQVVLIALLGCVGLASAGIVSSLFGNKLSQAGRALFSGAEIKSVEQVTDELHALKKASADAKDDKYVGVVKYYLAMRDLSADRCSLEQLMNITRPFESDFMEFSLQGYRSHWATEQFKLCKGQYEPKLKEAVDSLTEENKQMLEVFHNVTYKSYTGWRWKNPEWHLANTGLKLKEKGIGEYIEEFFEKLNKEQVIEDFKSKSDEEWAQEAVKKFHDITNSIFENTKSGSVVYFEAGYIPEVVNLFNEYELKWISELRTPNDMGATIEEHPATKEEVIKATAYAFHKAKASFEKYGY